MRSARCNVGAAFRRPHACGWTQLPAPSAQTSFFQMATSRFSSSSAMKPNGTMAPLSYPPEALKEIVVNAVIHRDYNVSDDIRVFVFDNRVTVRHETVYTPSPSSPRSA